MIQENVAAALTGDVIPMVGREVYAYYAASEMQLLEDSTCIVRTDEAHERTCRFSREGSGAGVELGGESACGAVCSGATSRDLETGKTQGTSGKGVGEVLGG